MSPALNLPVAILIFEDPNHQVHYRAYSPSQYIPNADNSADNIQAHQYSQFIAQIYNKLALDMQNPLANVTRYGKLKEVHIRFLQIPLSLRGPICYFSTYYNTHCSYMTVHRQTPIRFTNGDNGALGGGGNNLQFILEDCECEHEII
jgi:hypothetical protein